MKTDWTVCEAQQVIDNYKRLTQAELGNMLGRSGNEMRSICRALGVRKEVEFKKENVAQGRKFTPEARAMLFREMIAW